MPRIIVIGSSCSGKSTLSQQLSETFDIAYVQLDELNWKANWVEREHDEFLALLGETLDQYDDWVLDGNYSRTRPVSWPRAQVVVWLNYPFPLVFWRAIKRTCRRVFTKEVIFGGNVESFRRSFMSRDSILLWVITSFRRRKRRYRAQFDRNEYPHLKLIELRKPGEAPRVADRIRALECGR